MPPTLGAGITILQDRFVVRSKDVKFVLHLLQEAQLMLTNPRDAFRDQSWSPYSWYHMIPFDMLGIVSY